jgi:hypothetical protein
MKRPVPTLRERRRGDVHGGPESPRGDSDVVHAFDVRSFEAFHTASQRCAINAFIVSRKSRSSASFWTCFASLRGLESVFTLPFE